MFDPVA